MNNCVVDTLMRMRKAYNRSMEKVCDTYKLTMNEMSILVFLESNPEFDRATDFVERRGMSKSHVSLSVGALERRELLERHYNPGDRKSAHLSLTKDAEVMAKAGLKAQEEFVSRLFAGLSDEELEQWGGLTDQISANLDNMEI